MKRLNLSRHGRKKYTGLLVLLAAFFIHAGLAMGQNETQNSDRQWVRDIRQNIEQHSPADSPQSDQLMANLDRCLNQGMNSEQVQTMFSAGDFDNPDQVRDMLAHQDRILVVGEAGLPMEPMMEKFREGHMKHARAEMMDRVLAQTDHNIRVSDRVVRETVAGGVHPSGHPGEINSAIVDVSRCLWDGLHEEDLEHIGQNARMQSRNGGCGLGEFVAANQAATRFTQSGMQRHQAVVMASEALHNGYSAQEMHTMGDMMMTGTHWDGDHQEMMDNMGDWIHQGMSMDEMTEHMMDGGWMGPADMMGPGGSHPMNDMGWGGAGHHGGMGDDGMGGGMGDDGMGGGDDHH